MSTRPIIPIILAGGTGSRLWPLSREHFPKQLLVLVGGCSLLQETITRARAHPALLEPIVICNTQYRFLVAEQMLEMGIAQPQLILEPCGRNTAPAIAVAARLVQSLYPEQDPLLLILPADHLIKEMDVFSRAITEALPAAEQGALITFGITPRYAETGYGYIEKGEEIKAPLAKVRSFIEKPSKALAEKYLQTGQFYWNSGLFFFSAQAYLNELKRFRPDIHTASTESFVAGTHAGGFFSLPDEFNDCPSESIDYAVMEKTDRAFIYPLQATWSDIGSWTALHDILPQDHNGNLLQGDVTCINTHSSMIRAEHRLVATIGVTDLIVIETKDAVLVAHKDHAQQVKELVSQLKTQQREDLT